MEKPEHPILQDIVSYVEQVRELRRQIDGLKGSLPAVVGRLSEISDPDVRLAAARYCYWMLPEIGADDISRGLVRQRRSKDFMDLMGQVSVGLQCQVCDNVLPITSRTQMNAELERARKAAPQFAEGYVHVCRPCTDQIYRRRAEEHEKQQRRLSLRARELSELSHAEYLNTHDWQVRRSHELEIRRRYAGVGAILKCELCQDRDGLDLRHKVSSQKGSEGYDDLMLLCQACTGILSNAGRILE